MIALDVPDVSFWAGLLDLVQQVVTGIDVLLVAEICLGHIAQCVVTGEKRTAFQVITQHHDLTHRTRDRFEITQESTNGLWINIATMRVWYHDANPTASLGTLFLCARNRPTPLLSQAVNGFPLRPQ